MLKNFLFQPSLSFSFNAAILFLFLFLPFSVSALPPFVSFSSCLSFLFSSRVPFFSAQKHSFQPKTILSSTQKHFFQPKRFSAQTFLLQPKTFFSSAHTTVSASFCFVSAVFLFVGSVFSAPFLFVQRLLFFFLFQCLILFFLPTSKAKNFLFRCFTFLLFE